MLNAEQKHFLMAMGQMKITRRFNAGKRTAILQTTYPALKRCAIPGMFLRDDLAFNLRNSLRLVRVGLVLTAIAAILAIQAANAAVQPLRLHPDNPHYFLWRGKPTVLITAGEHYGAAMNLDFDFVRYLDELKANSFNLTRTFSGTYREVAGSFNITGNTLAPAAGRYICPWTRSETPAAADGGN